MTTIYEMKLDGKTGSFIILGPRAKIESTAKAAAKIYPRSKVDFTLREDLTESQARANNGAIIELKPIPYK